MNLLVAPGGCIGEPQRELGGKTCGLVVNGSVCCTKCIGEPPTRVGGCKTRGLAVKGSDCCTPQLTLGAHGIILLVCAFGSVVANQEIGVPGINAIIKDFVRPQRELGDVRLAGWW